MSIFEQSRFGLLWIEYREILPTILFCPFTVFGTLAIAESQAIRKRHDNTHDKPVSSRSSRKVSSPSMVTSSLGGVLRFYAHLPQMAARLCKPMLLNLMIDRLRLRPSVTYTDYSKHTIIYVLSSTLLAPVRLLCTEIIVFRRFDWRFLQLNAKALPILVPNLCQSLLVLCMELLEHPLALQWALFYAKAQSDASASVYAYGASIGLYSTLYGVLYSMHILAEVVRVRTDLLVLNGDSDHSILAIDESHAGNCLDAATSDEQYSIDDAIWRFLKVRTLPVICSRLLAIIMLR